MSLLAQAICTRTVSIRLPLISRSSVADPALILRAANLDRLSISVIGCRRPLARTAAPARRAREFAGGSDARLIGLTCAGVLTLSP